MERNSSVPEPVVIGQDEQTEIHVQPLVEDGRRHLDIRIWRRGTTGFAPSHDGLTLEAVDVAALNEGIAELLQASDGGRRVARVVRDSEDGRRLRAETEPFGTRYVARLGFWQRVRDTWKPADDGVLIAADRLRALQGVIDRLLPWIQVSEEEGRQVAAIAPRRDILDRWPAPGADWLTIEPDRVAFHPKGIRLTSTVTEQDNRHWLVIRQWRRDDTLWLPEAQSIALTITDLDNLLARLLRMQDTYYAGQEASHEEVPCTDGSTLSITVSRGEFGAVLRVMHRLPARAGLAPEEPSLSLPAEYLPRFGRALAQGWFLLAGWLSEAERTALQDEQEAKAEVATPGAPSSAPPAGSDVRLDAAASADGAAPNGTESAAGTPVREVEPPSEAVSEPADVPRDAAARSRAGTLRPRQILSFGAESETPGTVIPEEGKVRVVVEGFMLPRSLTLPVDVVAKVVVGLEDLNMLRKQQARVNPVLLCDRPDCAVYGRVGTAMRPDAVELRVWTGPTTSESVSFEVMYLPDLIEGLRQSLVVLGQPAPASPAALPIPASPPAPLPQPSAPARLRPIAPTSPLEAPGPLGPSGAASGAPAPLSIALGAVTLGHSRVALSIQGHSERPMLNLRWEANNLELPIDDLEELLADVRALYYDALRGRRGRALSVGEYPIVVISVQNQGTQLYCTLQQEVDGEVTALTFPASEVPTFLNAARAALSQS